MKPDEIKKRAKKLMAAIGEETDIYYSHDVDGIELIAAALLEVRDAALEEAARISEEGPWFSPCFEDEKIAEQWDQSEQAFGNQISVLIRALKSKPSTE